MKKIKKAAKLAAIAVLIIIAAMGAQSIGRAKDVQQSIAEKIIRFHVRANSDSKEDQALKLKVKEVLVESLGKKLSGIDKIEDAREIIRKELPGLEELAVETMQKHGYSYGAGASLAHCEFPLKIYGDMAFPAGSYEALVVELGEGKGKNWWCVMFPALCFVDGTYSIVPEESKEKLRAVLTEEDFGELLVKQNKKVKIKWKLAGEDGNWLNIFEGKVKM